MEQSKKLIKLALNQETLRNLIDPKPEFATRTIHPLQWRQVGLFSGLHSVATIL
jgi:hypothetical protein